MNQNELKSADDWAKLFKLHSCVGNKKFMTPIQQVLSEFSGLLTGNPDAVTSLREWQVKTMVEEIERLKEVEKERDEAKKGHCKDCCCAQSWKALGITQYTGKSIPEHITDLRNKLIFECDSSDQLSQLRTAYREALEALKHWKSYSESPIPANEDEQEQAGEDFTNVWFETDAILTNPLAIEVMKEKKV